MDIQTILHGLAQVQALSGPHWLQVTWRFPALLCRSVSGFQTLVSQEGQCLVIMLFDIPYQYKLKKKFGGGQGNVWFFFFWPAHKEVYFLSSSLERSVQVIWINIYWRANLLVVIFWPWPSYLTIKKLRGIKQVIRLGRESVRLMIVVLDCCFKDIILMV